MTSANLVEIDNVSFAYDSQRTILRGINLTIPRGKVVAIMGGSGCGKTTLLRLIGGQIKPTSEQLKSLLIEAIAQMAIAGRPFQATGQSGVYERRVDLPPTIRDLGRDKLHKLVRNLLDDGRIGRAALP